MIFNGNIVLNSNASGEIRNVYIERLATDPVTNLNNGRVIYNTTSNEYKYYDLSVTAWVPFAKSTTVAALQTEVNNIETSLGSVVNSSGVYQPFSGTNYINGNTSITQDLLDLDAAIAAVGAATDTLKELNDVDVDGEGTSGAYANKDLLQYLTGTGKWQNLAIGSASGVQAWDADLDAIAALAPANGDIIKRVGGAWTNVVHNLDNLEDVVLTAPATNHIIYFNGTNWVNSLITTVSNATLNLGDLKDVNDPIATYVNGTLYGLVGNGTLYNVAAVSLTTLNDVTITAPATDDFLVYNGGEFQNRTAAQSRTHLGLVAGGAGDIWVEKAGDTMSGNLNMGGNFVTNLATPTANDHAATKGYVDSVVQSLDVKTSVRVATTANINLTSAPASIDGVTLASGDRVLVKDQTTASQNGIYVFNGAASAMTRAVDADSNADVTSGLFTFVSEGTVNGDNGFVLVTDDPIVLDTTSLSFTQFSGAGQVIAGTGLSKTGNTLNVNLGAGIVELPTDEVGLDLFDAASGAIILTTTGTNRSTVTGAQLHLLLDTTSGQGANSLEQTSAGLRIKANGVTEDEITSAAFGNGLTGGSGVVITVNNENVGTAGTRGTLSFSSGKLGVDLDATGNGLGSSTKAASGNHNHTVDSLSNVNTTGKATNDLLAWDGTNWVDRAPSVVAGNINLDDLSDVTITSGSNGQALVFNGTTWVNKSVMYIHTGTGTSFTVTHNLGQKYCNVTVVDTSTDEVIIPDSIVFNTANQLTVTVNASISVKIVVMGVAGIS